MLGFPDPKEPCVLGASKSGLEALLSQVADGQEHVIDFFSQSLLEANHCATRRELLAFVAATEHFNPYLYGSQFFNTADHTALHESQGPNGQIVNKPSSLQL